MRGAFAAYWISATGEHGWAVGGELRHGQISVRGGISVFGPRDRGFARECPSVVMGQHAGRGVASRRVARFLSVRF